MKVKSTLFVGENSVVVWSPLDAQLAKAQSVVRQSTPKREQTKA